MSYVHTSFLQNTIIEIFLGIGGWDEVSEIEEWLRVVDLKFAPIPVAKHVS